MLVWMLEAGKYRLSNTLHLASNFWFPASTTSNELLVFTSHMPTAAELAGCTGSIVGIYLSLLDFQRAQNLFLATQRKATE